MSKPPRRLLRTVALVTGREPLPDSLTVSQRAILERIRALVTSRAIVGVGVSKKEIAGRETDEDALIFLVREKASPDEIEPSALVPPVILDWRGRAVLTDVRAVGEPVFQANVDDSPLRSGFSVSHVQGRAGTVTAIVRLNGQPHILGAKHVLSHFGRAQAGDAIVFPASSDGGQLPAARAGALLPYTPFLLSDNYPNALDAALARVDPQMASTFDRSIPGAATPIRLADPVNGMVVRLNGRTSGNNRRMTIKIPSVDWEADYPGLGFVGFFGQVACEPGGEGGDSGSPVIDTATDALVGLFVGGSPQVGYFTPIRKVVSGLGIAF